MKNTTKTIAAVLAVLLVATFFIGAASAERTVEAGQDAFVFETIAIEGTVPTFTLASSSNLANATKTENGGKLDYANPAGENITTTTTTYGTGYYAYLYVGTSGSKDTPSNLATPGTSPVYINNSSSSSAPFKEYTGPTETVSYLIGEKTESVNLMKLAVFTQGYDARSNKTNFSYVVSENGLFTGATSSGDLVQNFKNLTGSEEVELQPDNTFLATVDGKKVPVYVNVTQGQANDIGQSDWASKTVMKITAVKTPGTTMDILVAPLFQYKPAEKGDITFPLKLTKYSEGSNPTAVNQISSDGEGKIYLTKEVVNSQYGAYYYNDTPAIVGNKDFIYIWYPEISLQAELSDEKGITAGDSIDGKTVNKDTPVAFLINAPKVAPAYYQAKTPAYAKIIFTTPASGKTTEFGTGNFVKNFGDVELKAAQTNAGYTQAGEDATAGTWTAQAEFVTAPFKDYAEKSNTISFTLQSNTLTITASKDSVVRSNPFTVTIGGKSQTEYAVYIESPATNEVNPTLQPAQSGFQDSYNAPAPETYYSIVNGKIFYAGYSDAIGGVFKTDASGKRTIQFNTAANTEDKTYTIKVSGLTTNDAGAIIFDSGDYDKVKVKVEKGAVTISASGDGSYYLGDEIKLSGTNSDSKLVFLFITGKNLGSADGNVLKSLPTLKQAALATNPVVVNTDNTWEYKWDTSRISVDPGAYTIYATSRLTNGKASTPFNVDGKESEMYGSKIEGETGLWAVKLSDSEYATISVNLKKPFLSAVPSGTVVAKGDSFYVRGTAEGNPNSLKIYIFGNNFFEDYSVSVEDSGNYEKKIDIPEGMSSGQYFVVIQHPMMNAMFDADLAQDEAGYEYFYIPNVKLAATSSQSSFYVTGSDRLPGDQAADALTKMIDSPNIDDIYTKLTFNVADAWIRIANPGDKAAGSKFTISGTTNLAIDDQVLVEVSSSSFEATEKTQDLGNSGVTQTTKVVAGESGDNVWSIEVDTTNWKLDEYSIKAQGIEVDATTTTNFNLLEKLPDTPKPTETGATAVPTTATATATATPSTPGFGAFIALAGLGAVALLVLRRN